MKRLIILLALIFSLCPVRAQEREKSATEMKAEIAALQSKLNDQQQKDNQFASKFAGFGKELGTTMNSFVEAMDGGMKVTTTRVNEFAKTDVGRFAMVAIAWKIFSTDIISIFQSAFNKTAGFIFLIAFLWLLKRTIEILCWGRMIVMKKEGPWWNSKVTKERTTPIMKDSHIDSEATYTFITISVIVMICLFIASAIGLTH